MNNAVQAAVACNALGILVCDWSLPGQVNPTTVSIPALLAGAGLAWKAETDLVSEFCGEKARAKHEEADLFSLLAGSGWKRHILRAKSRDNRRLFESPFHA